MPFSKPSDAELDRLADELLTHLRRSEHDPVSATRGATFADMERTARAVAQRLATRLTADMLVATADGAPEFAPCPQCRHVSRVTRKKRHVLTPDGPVEYLEPAAHCLACRGDFLPPAAPTETR